MGLYIVSVGYFVAGTPGAIAGWAAMVTPALLIIPLVYFVGRQPENPRIKSILQTVVIAGLPAAVIPRSAMALVASSGGDHQFHSGLPNTGRHCRCGRSPTGENTYVQLVIALVVSEMPRHQDCGRRCTFGSIRFMALVFGHASCAQ
jgi:hypothetical protein